MASHEETLATCEPAQPKILKPEPYTPKTINLQSLTLDSKYISKTYIGP